MEKSRIVQSAVLLSTLGLTLAACGNKDSSSNKSSSNNSSNKMTIMAPFIETEPPAKDNAVQKAIEKLTGTKITVNWTPNTSYEDKMNITLASDDIPQVMVIQGKSGGFIKSAQNGAFWDLTKEIAKYPNLAKEDPNVQKNASVNGKVYGVYRGRDVMRSAVVIRKDWLKKVGMSEPKSVEDLYNIAKAFKEDDPDGNGKNDTYGLIIPKWPGAINTSSPYDVLATWFGAGNAWKESNGKLTPSFMNDKYLDSMKFVKKMIDEKLVNPDYATLSADKWNTPFASGKGGIIIDTYSRQGAITSLFKQSNPKDWENYVTFTGTLTGPDGKMHALPTDGYSGFLAVPKESVKTKAQLKKVLTFLDKLSSPDGVTLLNTGIKDVNYKVEDNMTVQITPETPKLKAINTAVKSYAQLSMGQSKYQTKPATDFETTQMKKRRELMKSDEKSAVFNPAASIVTDTYTTKGVQLDQIISDARLKFVAGQIDEKGWKDAISQWKTAGGSQLIKETNKSYAKMK